MKLYIIVLRNQAIPYALASTSRDKIMWKDSPRGKTWYGTPNTLIIRIHLSLRTAGI